MSVEMNPLVALLASCIVFTYGGCPCPDEQTTLLDEFETCADRTCGWQTDDPERVQVVNTIHPAEHGLELDGATLISRGISVDNHPLEIQLISTCPESIVVGVSYSTSEGDVTEEHRFPMQAISPGDDPGAPYYLLSAIVDPGRFESILVTGISIENTGGRCVIDQLRMKVVPEC